MKAALGHAVNSSDLEQQTWDCAIDKVHALGLCKGFGSDFVRFLDGLQPQGYARLVHALAKPLLRSGINRKMAMRLCELAIYEKTVPHCLSCFGAGEVMGGEIEKNGKIVGRLKIVCTKCSGTGAKRYTDADRAIFMGIPVHSYHSAWNKRLKDITNMLDENYSQTLWAAKRRLTSEDNHD